MSTIAQIAVQLAFAATGAAKAKKNKADNETDTKAQKDTFKDAANSDRLKKINIVDEVVANIIDGKIPSEATIRQFAQLASEPLPQETIDLFREKIRLMDQEKRTLSDQYVALEDEALKNRTILDPKLRSIIHKRFIKLNSLRGFMADNIGFQNNPPVKSEPTEKQARKLKLYNRLVAAIAGHDKGSIKQIREQLSDLRDVKLPLADKLVYKYVRKPRVANKSVDLTKQLTDANFFDTQNSETERLQLFRKIGGIHAKMSVVGKLGWVYSEAAGHQVDENMVNEILLK